MTIQQLQQNLNFIKKIIGFENFPDNKENLLIQAFVRRSYSQVHPEWQLNQVLEFIGDSVLDAYFVRKMCLPQNNVFGSFTKKYQFVSTKTEGELTKIKADYVNGTVLARHIDNLHLAQFLILGKADENNNVRNKQAVKEDLFESIIGAVALASNFQNEVIDEVCEKMLELKPQEQDASKKQKVKEMRRLTGSPDAISLDNAINKLLLLAQKKYISVPLYSNPQKPIEFDDNGYPVWEISCKVQEYQQYWTSKGSSKKEVKQAAAYHLLCYTILEYKQE